MKQDIRNNNIKAILSISVLIFGISYALLINADPYVEVYMSYTTGECVKVVSEDSNWSCDNLPETYTHISVR